MFLLLTTALPAHAERLKDLADLYGARANQLAGYGLVVGLDGTGDDAQVGFSTQSVVTMLRRLGVHVDDDRLRLKNVAAVVITAELAAFTAPGQRVDVLVSSIGNAKSLTGGTLLSTQLRGADAQVYAVAQGPVSVGGYAVSGETGSRAQKNHTTVGRVPGGALVEREIPVELHELASLRIALRTPDFTTSVRVASVIQGRLDTLFPAAEGAEAPLPTAKSVDAGSVLVNLPEGREWDVPTLMAELEALEVQPDIPTRVVINERTGTVVLGDGVRISPVAIAHGGLTIEVQETLIPSQPAPFSQGGETVVVPNTQVSAKEATGQLSVVSPGADLGAVVKALNALGVTPRDLVAILQALKSSGALRAELVVQ